MLDPEPSDRMCKLSSAFWAGLSLICLGFAVWFSISQGLSSGGAKIGGLLFVFCNVVAFLFPARLRIELMFLSWPW